MDTAHTGAHPGPREGLKSTLIDCCLATSTKMPPVRGPPVSAGTDEPEMVELLVKSGAAKHPRYAKSAHTALSWAVTCWSFRAAKKLVDLGDEPDLFCASSLGLLEKVRSFWTDGVLRSSPSITGSSRVSDTGERLPCPPERDLDQVSDVVRE